MLAQATSTGPRPRRTPFCFLSTTVLSASVLTPCCVGLVFRSTRLSTRRCANVTAALSPGEEKRSSVQRKMVLLNHEEHVPPTKSRARVQQAHWAEQRVPDGVPGQSQWQPRHEWLGARVDVLLLTCRRRLPSQLPVGVASRQCVSQASTSG
jgi:hypothetical protein